MPLEGEAREAVEGRARNLGQVQVGPLHDHPREPVGADEHAHGRRQRAAVELPVGRERGEPNPRAADRRPNPQTNLATRSQRPVWACYATNVVCRLARIARDQVAWRGAGARGRADVRGRLDPVRRLHRVDENGVAEVAPLLAYLHELQRELGCAVVLVHQARKRGHGQALRGHGQALRGSTELHAWGDSNLYLCRDGERLLLSIEHRAAASCAGIELSLVMGPVPPRSGGLPIHAE